MSAGTGGATHLVVTTSTADRALAGRIARALVERRLAACAHVAACASVYRWQGAVEAADEYTVSAITRAALFGAVRDAILALHDYDLPQVAAVPLVAGSAEYLAWVGSETDAPG